MLVFLSWSGARSKAVAEALQGWLKKVIQAVEPWISVDIEKGKRWTPQISEKLGQSNVGVFCLTKDNLKSPWLLFEAGAISKNKEGTVCTFLLDLTPGDLENPMAQFQATIAEKEDTFRLVQSINQEVQVIHEKWLPEGDLKESFEAWWPKLDQQLKSIKAQSPASPSPLRDQREMLEEILELLREQARSRDEQNREAQREAQRHAELMHQLAVQNEAMVRVQPAETPRTIYEAFRPGGADEIREALKILQRHAGTEQGEEKKSGKPDSPSGKKAKGD